MNHRNIAAPALKSGLPDLLFDFLRVSNVIAIYVAAYIAYIARFHVWQFNAHYHILIILGVILFIFLSQSLRLYKIINISTPLRCIASVFSVVTSTFIALILLLFFTKYADDTSRLWLTYWYELTLFFLLIVHLSTHRWFRKQLSSNKLQRRIVLFGTTRRAKALIERIRDDEQSSSSIMCIFCNHFREGGKAPKSFMGKPILTDFQELVAYCREHRIDDVILTEAVQSSAAYEQLIMRLQELPCNVKYCLPTPFFDKGIKTDNIWGVPLVTIYRRPMEGRKLVQKRAFDLVLAVILAVPTCLVMGVIAILLKLTGQPKIFFRQRRNGFYGDVFEVYKFRTMTVAEDDPNAPLKQAEKEDSRITPLGKILRKISLDEIPQLINVLKGDMSFVGPRPHAISHNREYGEIIDKYAARHHMKPGITGWAQVNGWRGETDTIEKMQKRIEYDLYYMENWSLILDIKILALTGLVFFDKNAY